MRADSTGFHALENYNGENVSLRVNVTTNNVAPLTRKEAIQQLNQAKNWCASMQ
jgi:hypothetical protein